MTEEERQDEINKEFDKYFPIGTSFEKAYRKLKRYNGKYKNDFTNILANMIIDEYCAGYYRYGKKQTDIKNPQKELYLTICDDLLPDQCDLDEAIYCFIKGINRKVIPCIEKVFKNFEANNKGEPPNEFYFCIMLLDHFKEGYKGFWKELTDLSRKYAYETCTELSDLMDRFYSCEDNNSAIDLLLVFSQKHPDYVLPYELLGFLYSDEKMWYNAIQCFEKIRGRNLLFYSRNIEFALGWAYGKIKDYREEEKAYRKCLESAPWYSNALNNLGYSLYNQKKYDEAIDIFKQCIHEKRDLAYAPNNLIRTYLKVGLYEDARKFIAEHNFKISKYYIDQLDKKPKKNIISSPPTIADTVVGDVEDLDIQVEEEVKPKFFDKKSQFTNEKILEDELTARLESGQPVFGLDLHIYRKKGDFYGRQYPCANGKWRLDLLCEDNAENLYIIELKKDSGYDDAFEQIKQYVDWFEKHKVKRGKKVYGIIVLNSPKKKLIEKVRSDSRIRLYEYQIAFREIL